MFRDWKASRSAMQRTIAKQADEIQRLHIQLQELQHANTKINHELMIYRRATKATT